MARIDKENYYLDIAGIVLERSTCMRKHYGAIIVQNDAREAMKIPSGERYELCRSVHAEANAIVSAHRREVLGATLYMACRDPATGELIPGATSCSMCRRLIINAGIAKVVIRDTPAEYRVVDVQREWIDQDDSIPELWQ